MGNTAYVGKLFLARAVAARRSWSTVTDRTGQAGAAALCGAGPEQAQLRGLATGLVYTTPFKPCALSMA